MNESQFAKTEKYWMKSDQYEAAAAILMGYLSNCAPDLRLWPVEVWEHRVAVVACRTLGVTREFWDSLNQVERTPWLESVIEEVVK